VGVEVDLEVGMGEQASAGERVVDCAALPAGFCVERLLVCRTQTNRTESRAPVGNLGESSASECERIPIWRSHIWSCIRNGGLASVLPCLGHVCVCKDSKGVRCGLSSRMWGGYGVCFRHGVRTLLDEEASG